jgi:3-methyladenine DNA glycosylase AlkD
MSKEILSRVRSELLEQADEKTRVGAQKYFKGETRYYGVRMPLVHNLAASYFPEVTLLGKAGVFELCEDLWKSGYSEEAFIACDWSYRFHKEYIPEDFVIFEGWLTRYVNDWAKCDTLCNHTIGSFVEIYPRYLENLKQWTKSENRWLRRGAAVTLIIPAKRGKFLKDIFEIADNLLKDKEDLVQKGYGWMLKEASNKYRTEVFHYVMKNKKDMPRTALRYAIERMPPGFKAQAMAKD